MIFRGKYENIQYALRSIFQILQIIIMHAQAVILKLLILCFFLLDAKAQSSFCNISATNQYVGGTTSHSIICSFQNFTIFSNNSYIIVGYSTSWVISGVTKNGASDFCESNCTLASVSISPGISNIRITGLIPNALAHGYFTFRYTLNNILNPTFKTTQTISIAFFNNDNSSIITKSATINIYPSAMTCSVSLSNSALYGNSTYTFTVTPAVTLPSSGYLKMTFPTIWRNSLTAPTLNYSSCSANCSAVGNVVTARNVIATSSSSPFTFTLNYVVNPGTEEPNNDLLLTYFYTNDSQISYCIVPITGLISPTLNGVNFIISANIGTLTYTNVLLPLSTDQLLATFPPEISISNYLSAGIFNGNSTTSLPFIPNRIITGTNQISIPPYVPSTTITNTRVVYTSLYFLKPATNITVIFALRRGTYQYSYANCYVTQNSTQSMVIQQVTLTSYILKDTSSYLITFIPTYYDIYYLIADFGSAFSFTNSTIFPCYFSMLTNTSQTVCTAFSATQIKVTLANTSASFASFLGFASNYTLVISSLSNPSQLNTTITLSSYYLPSNQLESSNSYPVTYLTTLILNAKVTPNNTQVGAIASYTFIINNTNNLLPSSIIHIYFPSAFNLSNYNCTTSTPSCYCSTTNATYLQFTLPNSNISSYALPSTSLTVLNISNPNSLMPTASFGIALQSGTSIVEAIYDGVVVNMDTVAHFSSLLVTPNTKNVGTLASYTIDFEHQLAISSSSVITLSFQLPSPLTLVSCAACTSFQTFTINPLNHSNTSVVISSIYNPQQTIVSSGIVVSLSVDGYLSIQDTADIINYTSLNTTWTLKANSTYLGDPVNINLTIQTLPLNTQFFLIIIPSQYGLVAVTTSTDASMNCICILTGYSLNCSVSFISSINTTLILSGITNPTSISSSYWQISIYAASAILISSDNSTFQFVAACGGNCRDCINSSFCKSCYSNSSINNKTYLDYSINQCVSGCNSTGQFLVGSSCYNCNSSCLTCSLFSSNCTTCSNGTYLYGGSCLSQCPDTYYSSAQNCTPCTNNCLTCTSFSICQSCATNYVLQSNFSCLLSCPSGQFNSSNFCENCTANCLTCDVSGCLTCAASYMLTGFTRKSCVSSCPTDTYMSPNNLTCQTCQNPCLTCSIYSNNCTSCLNSSGNISLSNFKCFATCPNQTYNDELNQCQTCQSPCLTCSDLNKCTSCASPLVLYNATNQCLSSCFSNTINVTGICVQCISPCLTCSGTVLTCTSCIESYFYFNSTCLPNCTSPYIISGNNCSLCYLPCLSCPNGSQYNCTSCIPGYYKFVDYCYLACPNNTFAANATTCLSCSPPCYQCSGSSTNCTGCFTGSFNYNGTCYSPCPPKLYQVNITCQPCQTQCFDCNHTYSNQCSNCSSNLYYFNPITYHCTLNCTVPYFINSNASICEPCQLPCKTCLGFSSQCTGCYTGYFLSSQQCKTSCEAGFYENSTSNVCTQCTSPCATCDSQKCFTCSGGAYFYDGMCYTVCPPQAPNIYNIYCRNCLKNNCIKCNTQGACTMCEPGYYKYSGQCMLSCPSDYQPDLISNSECILKSDIAYFNYIKVLETQKIWLMPSSIVLFLFLPFLYFADVKIFCFAFILGTPQVFSLVELTSNYVHQWSVLIKPILPIWLMYTIVGGHLVCSIIYTLILKNQLQKEQSFTKWIQYGSNQFRYTIVLIFSCFNKQIIFILFSGLFNLPFTSFKFKVFKSFYKLHAASLFLEFIIIAIGYLIAVYQNTLQYNYKLFYSAVDTLIVYLIAIIFQFIFLFKIQNHATASSYQKFIIPDVSNNTLPALSIFNDDIPEDTTHNNLHRSNSDENMLESQQMKNVEFMSVLDPDDYHDETPQLPLDQVEQGIQKGDFRKKNKKKRGQRRFGKLDLDIIQEEDQDIIEKPGAWKKKKISKNEDIGGLKNYLYWKKPAAKKANPAKVFKQHENEIMQRIKEKQSQFDSITQNDIIFQNYNEDQDSSDDNYHVQEESRRALQKPIYDNYFNLNYASKKHLFDV